MIMTEQSSSEVPPPAVIADLAQRYKEQFSSTIETVRRRSVQLTDEVQLAGEKITKFVTNDLEPALRQQQEQATAIIGDLSEVPPKSGSQDTFKFVLETYAWTSVCLLGASLSGLVGASLMAPVISFFFSDLYALVVAHIVLPYYFYLYNRSDKETSQEDKRMLLFALSLAVGMLNGYNLMACRTTVVVPAFVGPLVVAITSELVGPKYSDNRPVLLAACVGAAASTQLTIGLLTGSISQGFVIATLFSAVMSAVGLQYMLASVKNGEAEMIEMQLVQVCSTITMGALSAYFLRTPKNGNP